MAPTGKPPAAHHELIALQYAALAFQSGQLHPLITSETTDGTSDLPQSPDAHKITRPTYCLTLHLNYVYWPKPGNVGRIPVLPEYLKS